MKIRLKSIALIFILTAFVFLAGCFYLRLQQVKEQLAQFDRYYEIKEGEYFSLIAKEPVLLSSDVVRIMRSPPSFVDGNEPNFAFAYIMEKQYPPGVNEPVNYSVIISFMFENDKLRETLIDQRLFTAVPKKTFISIIKSFGTAKVDFGSQSVSASALADKTKLMRLPDANEIVNILGMPYSQQEQSYIYKYQWKLPDGFEPNEAKTIDAAFTFDQKGNMLKCKSNLLGSPVELDFGSWYEPNDTGENSKTTKK